jgi:hypothetical protein
MNVNEFKKLGQYQREVARLQRSLARFNRRLAALPARHGFKSVEDFIDALRQAVASEGKAPVKGTKPARRRKRAVITAETKQKVKALHASKKTGREISAALGISLPSVQNIKKELGLVKKRS